MIKMENPEEILQILERYSRTKPRDIPEELETYLRFVAKTGDTVFKWPMIQALYREKLRSVIQNFYETTASIADLPHYPNVDPFNFESMKKMLLDRMDMFHAAPFTIQRLSELLTEPRKQYSRIDKFMRAIEKNVLVVSPAEPQRKRHESENGESLDSTLSMNGDICSDLDIGVENDHGALNLHETPKADDLVKLDGADALDDDVPLDKLEPEVNVFTPEGDLDMVVSESEAETKLDTVPNGSSTPEPATTSTAADTSSLPADVTVTPIQQDQVESSGDNLNNTALEAAPVVESSQPAESSDTKIEQVTTEPTESNESAQPQQSSDLNITSEASPGKRTFEDDDDSEDQQTPSEAAVEPSPSKKQKIDEDENEINTAVVSTTDLIATAVDNSALIESSTTTTETPANEPSTTVDSADTAVSSAPDDNSDKSVSLTPDQSDAATTPLTTPIVDAPESSVTELDISATTPAAIDSQFEGEARLIDISLTAEPSTTATTNDLPSEDIISSMIETPIMEQLQSTVTNPPIDPIRLPPIESIIPDNSAVTIVSSGGDGIDVTQSMEVAKVDDDLMKVDLPTGAATTSVQGCENKMQTDDDEAPVTSEMDVDESSADFMDQ